MSTSNAETHVKCKCFAGDGPHYSCLICGEEGVKHEGVTCTKPDCWICRQRAERAKQ